MPDELDELRAEPAPVETTTALTINNDDVEIIRGKPALKLEEALKLVAEYNRLFPSGMGFALLGCDWMSLPGEKSVFENAFKQKMDEAMRRLGVPSGSKMSEQSQDIKDQFEALVFPKKDGYSTPYVRSLFEDRKVKTTAEILALVDDEKGPLDRMYIEACLRDARINVVVLLQRMHNRMDLRDVFPETYPETDEMREGFRQMIDQILEHLGFDKVQPMMAVIKM